MTGRFFSRTLLIGMLSFFGMRAALAQPEAEWLTQARRLTGESERVRKNAIERLRREPGLSAKILGSLGTSDRFLALDVVTALEMKALVPELLRDADLDPSGYSYHALNTLMDAKNRKELLRVYAERLGRKETPVSAKIAILDSLSRTGENLPAALLDELFANADPDLRSSAIAYVRSRVFRWNRVQYFPFFAKGLTDSAFQNRVQTLIYLSHSPIEFRQRNRASLTKLLASCANDPVEEVRNLCLKTDFAAVVKPGAKR